MIRVRLTVIAVITVFAATLFFSAGASYAGVSEGKGIFNSKNCGDCHQTQGPAKEKTIEDQLAKKGPELWYSGSKFQKAFLDKWLKDPKPIRPMEFYSLTKKNSGNHPKLAGKEAEEVVAYLMSLTSVDVKAMGLKPKGSPQGRLLFDKKQGCYGCHSITKGGAIAGGVTGPTLIGAGQRLNPDWIYAYFVNPKVFKPVKDMPVYVGIFTEAEMKMLAEYVASL